MDQEPVCPTRPLVSVVVPCFNHGRFLAEALESLLAQTYEHIEIVVVDDGSTDDTPAVAARFALRVRYVRQENRGLAAARNAGLAASGGELLNFLDADDYHEPDAIERMVAAATADPGADVFHGRHRCVDRDRNPLTSYPVAELSRDAFHQLLVKNRMICHSVLVRRRALVGAGGFDEQLRALEDWDCWLRLAAGGCRFVAVAAAVAVYRRYPGTMSRGYDRMKEAYGQVLRRARTVHPDCAKCRRLIRVSQRTFHLGAFGSILLPNARLLWSTGHRWSALRGLWAAAAADPGALGGMMRYPFAVAAELLQRLPGTR
jgi:glycosyltransferase involved in cell wall biosynthesis